MGNALAVDATFAEPTRFRAFFVFNRQTLIVRRQIPRDEKKGAVVWTRC